MEQAESCGGTGTQTGENVTGRKVIFVHNTTQYLHLHYVELMRTFQERGWDVSCVSPRDPATVPLEAIGVQCIDVSLSRRGMNPFMEVGVLGSLYRVFRRERPDAVLNFSIKPAIYSSTAARLAGVPRVCSMITGLGYVFLGQGVLRGLLSAGASWGYRAALAGNHRVFFQNPDDCRFFTERGMVKNDQSIVLNGTGIDTERFSPRPGAAREAGTGFLMVTRMLSDKGVREFVDAARRLRSRYPDIRCALLGPRDDNPSVISTQEIQSWTDEGCVEYLGETDDVAAVIAGYDVFVLPSYREGLPRATLEAMAMAKPVVTTDVPGCRETVEEGVNGFLVPARDPGALAAAMERFVANPSLIETMGNASREMALRKYDVHKVNQLIVQTITGDEHNA